MYNLGVAKKQRLSLRNTFLIALTAALILFWAEVVIANDLSNTSSTIGQIVVLIIAAVLGLPLFIVGLIKSLKQKTPNWASINIVAIAIIIVWTGYISIALYSFNGFQLILPNN